MKGLGRLEGANDPSEETFSAGKGVYLISFKADPKAKPSDVAAAVKPFKVDVIKATVTRKVEVKDKSLMAGNFTLANMPKKDGEDPIDVLGQVEKLIKSGQSTLQLSGILTEDDKGKATLALTMAQAAAKK